MVSRRASLTVDPVKKGLTSRDVRLEVPWLSPDLPLFAGERQFRGRSHSLLGLPEFTSAFRKGNGTPLVETPKLPVEHQFARTRQEEAYRMSLREESRTGKLRVLEGEKIRLRPVEDEDIPKLMEWENDADIVRWAGKKFETVEDAREWHLRPTLQHRTFAIELLGGRLIGEIEVLNITWKIGTAEIRVIIGEKDLWDRGLGEDAVSTLVNACFSVTALQEIFLRVDQDNGRARRCYEKVGFKPEGRVTCTWEDGSPRTILLMRLRKAD